MNVMGHFTDFQQDESNVVRLGDLKDEREAVEATVLDYCRMRHLSFVQAQAAVERAHGFPGTSAKKIEEGRKKADEIAEKMREIRTRFGTRDDDGPRAA